MKLPKQTRRLGAYIKGAVFGAIVIVALNSFNFVIMVNIMPNGQGVIMDGLK